MIHVWIYSFTMKEKMGNKFWNLKGLGLFSLTLHIQFRNVYNKNIREQLL